MFNFLLILFNSGFTCGLSKETITFNGTSCFVQTLLKNGDNLV